MTETIEKPLFRKGQTVWRQHNGKVQEGRIYQVARVKFRNSGGYDDDDGGPDLMYRARFGEPSWSSDLEQANDGELWKSTFTADKKEAYRKLREAAHGEVLRLAEELHRWAKIEEAASYGRDKI